MVCNIIMNKNKKPTISDYIKQVFKHFLNKYGKIEI